MILLYNNVHEQQAHSLGEVEVMDVKDAITLMFMFGMFILALLGYIKKK
ncbi:putative holin-like toxin [Paenibacillus jilunlii]